MAAGVRTIRQLADRTDPVDGIGDEQLITLSSQARLQLIEPTDALPLPFEVFNPQALRAMPPPSEGDVFFDFEGDPMWRDEQGVAGLEYLFGCLTADGFTPFWAHDRVAEKRALTDFVQWLRERRGRWPELHVYHFAGYEQSALTRLAARHGCFEEEIAAWLDEGVFVDLYAVVKAGVRVGSRSYSIKRLEALYMGDDLRDAHGVTGGGDSIITYQRYREAINEGDQQSAAGHLADLQQYNEYDCVSTLRLRDWLVEAAGTPRD